MKEVLNFLQDLSANNNREWMHANKKRYEGAKSDFHNIIGQLIEGIGRFEEGVQGLTPKDCAFRLNRDIRFSKDKSPYKTNFGAAIMEGGKKSPNPTYYIHIQPGQSFIAGGIYMPEAENLKKIRQEIDYNPEELKKVVEGKNFKEIFGTMTGEQLKTAPKGYPKDHPNIELLRFKSFLVSKNLTDREVLAKDFVQSIISDFEVVHPFNQYFAVAIS